MSNAENVERQKWTMLNIVTNPKNICAGFGGKSNPFILLLKSWISRLFKLKFYSSS